MCKNILLILMLAIAQIAFGQLKHPANAIPDTLLKNAYLVIREYDLTFQVLDKGKAIETEHYVITLLNEKASDMSSPKFYYYEFEDIENIEASVYDSEGKLVRNLKKKDIEDGKPLMEGVYDVRYKELNLPSRSYPYTIDYTVIKKYKGLMFYPNFQPQFSPAVSVENASFELIMPTGLEARYKEVKVPSGSKVGPMRWEFKNIPAFRPEPFTPDNELNLAEIITAPNQFSFFGIEGDMQTWESYGAYLEKLNSPQRSISTELNAKLQAMVADCPDVYCKIQKVYEYLQTNTRYFYVGYGIGGWQPAAASKVDKYKYGDCKGLSNYTASMLNAVGVPARYAVIRAGDDEQLSQYPDFPNGHFNHAIVCVPMEKDTVWLECTSQTQSCGFMGDFTDNRPALVVTPTGGQLLRTPKYDENVNTILRETVVNLQSNGSAILSSKDVYAGISQGLIAELEGYHDEIRKKVLYKMLNINDFEIKSLEFVRKRDRIPSVQQNIELALPSYAAITGKRLFVPLSPLTAKVELPTQQPNRQSSVQAHSRGTTEEDHLTIVVPNGYEVESLLDQVNLETAFGSYTLSAKLEGKNLVVHRKLVLNSTVQPKESYPEYIAFLKSVAKSDKAKLVLKQTERP
jgi:Domain of Unknown Function with PDB structure (DUF3857)/Transglutaminase-like superfamily